MKKMPFLSSTNAVKTQKEMQNTDHNQWSGLILSSSTTILLTQGLLLSNASVNNDDTITMPKYVRLKCYNHDLRKRQQKDIL